LFTLRVRSRQLIAIGCLVILTTTQVSASAVVKAGAKCTKAGAVSTIAGKKFTCIKSGSKLVWNKGIAVKAAPKPEATPVFKPVEPTPSPTQTPTPPPVVKYPDAPTSFDDLIANYQGIAYAAWSKSNAAIMSSKDVAPPFTALTGPKTTLAFKNPASAYDLVARMYSGYKSTDAMIVLSFGYDDRDWAQEQMKMLQPKSTWQWITFTACATRATCWGGGMFTDEKANGLLVVTTEVLDDNHTTGTLDAHEYLHAIQQNQMRRPTVWPETNDWPPSWYREGQATFAQNAAIFHQSYELYLRNRRSISEGLINAPAINSAWIQEFFIVNQPQSWFNNYESWRQYDLGARLVEVLTAIKGPGSTMEIWKLMGTGQTFNSAFEKVYGTSFDKALPIISKAIALDLGRS